MQSNIKVVVYEILVLIFIYYIYQIVLGGTFFLPKKYISPNNTFNLNYPGDWNVCENWDYDSVSFVEGASHIKSTQYGDFGTIQGEQYTKVVISTPLSCDNFSSLNSKYLTITDLKIQTNETDIKTWIDINERKNEDIHKANIADGGLPITGLLPIYGVPEWKFVRYANNILPKQEDNTVAEVIYFADELTKYLVLSNNHLYVISFNPKTGPESLSGKHMLKSVKFL